MPHGGMGARGGIKTVVTAQHSSDSNDPELHIEEDWRIHAAIEHREAEAAIEKLLAKQMTFIKEVLVINAEIVKHIKEKGPLHEADASRPGEVPAAPAPVRVASPGTVPGDATLGEEVREAAADAGSLDAPLLTRKDSLDSPPESPGITRSKSRLLEKTEEEMELKRLANAPEDDDDDDDFAFEDNYADDGIFPAIARHAYFSNGMFGVIAIYTLWISIETDYNKAACLAQAPLIFQIVDNAFCFVFTFELIVRFMALKEKCSVIRDFEFLFDVVLVASMIWETWVVVAMYWISGAHSGGMRGITVLRVLRLFRLVRIGRTAKIVRAVPEFMIFVKGIFAAMRSVATIVVAMTLIIYVMGIMFVQLLSDDPVAKHRFETVPMAMNFLMLQVVCGLDSGPMLDILDVGWIYYLLYLAFVFILPLTAMNMLVGTVVNVVSAVGEGERDLLKADILKERITVMANKFHWDANGIMQKEKFVQQLKHPGILKELGKAEIDVTLLVDFLGSVIPDGGEVSRASFDDILHKFMNFRTTSVKDIMEVQQRHTLELAQVEERIVQLFRTNGQLA